MTHTVCVKLAPILTAERWDDPKWMRPDRVFYWPGSLKLIPRRPTPIVRDHDMDDVIGTVSELFTMPFTDGEWIVARGVIDNPPSWLQPHRTKASVGYWNVHSTPHINGSTRITSAIVQEVSLLRDLTPAEPLAEVALLQRIVLAAEQYMLTELPEFTLDDERVRRVPDPDDYLLYPEWRKGGRVYRANPKQPMPRQTIHRWWYEHLQRAGLVGEDVERGMNMHRARHTFATELRRDAGDLGVVQRMLGHSDIHTTEAFYGHYDLTDLEVAMEAFARRDAKIPTDRPPTPHG